MKVMFQVFIMAESTKVRQVTVELPIRYVNSAHGEARKIQLRIDRGYTVVNSTRPMRGDEDWDGDFIAGRFYVAGDIERWGQHWLDYGAYQIVIVTNAQVLQNLINKCAGHPYGVRLKETILKRRSDMGAQVIRELAWSMLEQPYYPDLCTDIKAEIAAADWSILEG